VNVELRAWQARFLSTLAGHDRPDFLLVACPAAGKTIAAAVAAARCMAEHGCDQLIVACPTVVVRDQWVRELGRLGFRMETEFGPGGWPEWAHGVCATYAQIAWRADTYRRMVAARRTVAILDEVHHAGAELSWGSALREAFAGAVLRLSLSGTPFRSDERTIPFIAYDPQGRCIPDFGYSYAQAVRDGACRTILFKPLDGTVTWLGDDDRPITAAFSERIPKLQRAARLRAALDPAKPYLSALLGHAHADLLRMRERVPDAAALVVADNQAHALQIDRLLAEIAGSLPVLAMSDIPRAHRAIINFAGDTEPWLVSVRMVSEGVDIPRLGVIVWATVASTELLVRQVCGRALRAGGEHAALPAIIHMPADERLTRYAQHLAVLRGVDGRVRDGGRRSGRPATDPELSGPGGFSSATKRDGVRYIDPAPFVRWFAVLERAIGLEAACAHCGWTYEAGARAVYRWREEGGWADTLTLFDACHMAGVDFDGIFAGETYAAARAYADDPLIELDGQDFRSVDAVARGPAEAITPIDARRERRAVPGTPVTVIAPQLPPTPRQLREQAAERQRRRGQVHRLMSTLVALERMVFPAYSMSTAAADLAAATGLRIIGNSPDEDVQAAIDWLTGRLRTFAEHHPRQVRELAQQRRRLDAAASIGAGP